MRNISFGATALTLNGRRSRRDTVTTLTAAAPARRLIFVNRYFLPDLSATSQLLTDLVRVLGRQGFELHVLCSGQLYADARARLPANECCAGVKVQRCWSTRFGRDGLLGRAADYASFLLSAGWRLLHLTRHGDVVVAMTDPPLLSVVVAVVAKVRNAKFINWIQDLFPEVAIALGVLRLPGWALAGLLRLRNWTLREAARNVVLGWGMRRRLEAAGIATGSVSIIENWADADALRPLPVQWSHLRRSLNAERRFVIQYSGNMGRAHDYETLLAAATELRDESSWLFLFVGGGANMQLLRRRAQTRALPNVCFRDLLPREQLGDGLAAADVHVSCLLPALEGLIVPSKLYGILAAGRPVIIIGDPDGEQARLVRGAQCGSVIAPGDAVGLVDELRRMRSAPEWMREAAVNARQLFERRFTAGAAASRWREVLESIG